VEKEALATKFDFHAVADVAASSTEVFFHAAVWNWAVCSCSTAVCASATSGRFKVGAGAGAGEGSFVNVDASD